MTHCIWVCVAPVSIAKLGSATFRPLTAETTIISAIATVISTSRRRRASVITVGLVVLAMAPPYSTFVE